MTKAKQGDSGQVVIYRTPDGKTSIEVHLEGDTVWLTQAQMAELFKNTKQNISLHTRNIFRERELEEEAVVKDSLTTEYLYRQGIGGAGKYRGILGSSAGGRPGAVLRRRLLRDAQHAIIEP